MAALDDPKTLGRTRLSFADAAEIDDFVDDARALRERRARAGSMAGVPAGARHLRPAAGGRRADAPHQDPAGHPRRGAAQCRGGCGGAVVARLRPHHDAAEFPAPFPEAPRRRARHAAPGRGRADDARGVRQLGPQHHGLPLCRRRRRRGLRRHPVCGGAHPLPAPAPAELDPAAEVQDRLRGLPRGSCGDGHQRHRLAGQGGDRRRRPRAWLPRDRRGRHVDLCEVRRRAVRLPARGGDARGRGGHPSRLPPARGLQAQAEEPDEVPRPLARLRRVAGRVREGARPRPGRRRRRPCPSTPSARRSRPRPTGPARRRRRSPSRRGAPPLRRCAAPASSPRSGPHCPC